MWKSLFHVHVYRAPHTIHFHRFDESNQYLHSQSQSNSLHSQSQSNITNITEWGLQLDFPFVSRTLARRCIVAFAFRNLECRISMRFIIPFKIFDFKLAIKRIWHALLLAALKFIHISKIFVSLRSLRLMVDLRTATNCRNLLHKHNQYTLFAKHFVSPKVFISCSCGQQFGRFVMLNFFCSFQRKK